MKRVIYRGRLAFPEGFHTGDGRRLEAVDQPLFRDSDGGVSLAGSSLAGVLRNDLNLLHEALGGPRCKERPKCSCPVCRLMGPRAETDRRGDETPLAASRLYVSAGRACERPMVNVRDRVGIDRRTRTAADERKYDLETVEGGVVFPLELRIDDPAEDELALLEASLRRLAEGWWSLGGKTSSGLGRARLQELTRERLDLADRGTLIAYLLDEPPPAGGLESLLGPEGAWAEPGSHLPHAAGAGEGGWAQVAIRLRLHFPWGFLVNDPGESAIRGKDHSFTRRPDGTPLLPGSSLRGALRSHAERILRTLAGDGGACDLHRKGKACHERVLKVNEDRAKDKALTFDDELKLLCPACRSFGCGRLVSSIKVTDFQAVPGHGGQELHHELVAIDRFTGGAAEGFKFDAEAAEGACLEGEIRLDLRTERLEPWGLGLLALTLRDLLRGEIPLGFGTAKGLNEVEVSVREVAIFRAAATSALALGCLPAEPGTHRWHLEGTAGDPETVIAAAQRLFETEAQGWVTALHDHLGRTTNTTQAQEAAP
ncbi:MAG TPA: RAMP superfamily CRISPR-associated protein [Thermoanaerobaculia bacterium]|nr:RAMP superfamily CRISPR-associated protein [Thermoanaerobaculia bacterium]